MDAVAALARVTSLQRCFEVIGALMLTAYLFPKQALVTDLEQFDFIVVGAGSAGSVVAARLAAAHFSVLLVEAGGDPPQESLTPSLLGFLPHTRYDWNYTSENDNYSFQCHRSKTANLTSGRILGGGSSINYMFYVRGCPDDFNPWAAAAHDDPTWSWSGVLPYFIKSENLNDPEINSLPLSVYHGTGGFLGVTRNVNCSAEKYLKSFEELGNSLILDINADCSLGYTYPMVTINDGVRQSTAYTILAAHKNDPHLKILKETFVTKIVFDENNNAIGIEAVSNNKRIELRARREVIVSAGALNTPRLLMLSGIGPKKHLESFNIPTKSDLPVGMNLQDHVPIMMSIKLEESTEPPPDIDPRRFPFDTFTGYVALNKSQTCPDYQSINFIVPNDSDGILNLCVFNFGYDFEICQKFYDAGKGRRTLFTTLGLLHPKSRGRVLLRSINPSDPPIIQGGYLSDDRDLETIVDSMIDFTKVLNTTYFKSINAELADLDLPACKNLPNWSREWWRCYSKCLMSTLYHYSGTCALGSVVDSHLRVFGVKRLRVVDASIMPELVSANTNAAAIMIGEKAADFIKHDHIDVTSSLLYFIPHWTGFNMIK